MGHSQTIPSSSFSRRARQPDRPISAIAGSELSGQSPMARVFQDWEPLDPYECPSECPSEIPVRMPMRAPPVAPLCRPCSNGFLFSFRVTHPDFESRVTSSSFALGSAALDLAAQNYVIGLLQPGLRLRGFLRKTQRGQNCPQNLTRLVPHVPPSAQTRSSFVRGIAFWKWCTRTCEPILDRLTDPSTSGLIYFVLRQKQRNRPKQRGRSCSKRPIAASLVH